MQTLVRKVSNTLALALLISFTNLGIADPVKTNLGLFGGYIADIEAMDNGGTTEILIAVENSQRGIYRYDRSGPIWASESNPPGTHPTGLQTPGYASQVEADPSNPGFVFATLSNDATFVERQLYGHTNYGIAAGTADFWQSVTYPDGSDITDVVMLHGHSSGMYFAQPDSVQVITSGGATITTVFKTSALSGITPANWSIVDFAVVSASDGYVSIRRKNTDNFRLYRVNFSFGSGSRVTLPAASPIEVRTGTCPSGFTSCDVFVESIAADPVDTSGNTIYIAGSSVNPMVFKSSDGGVTWDDGADYQCIQSTDPACSGGEFFDGYPRGDVVRFKDTAASGLESRHVFISRTVFDNDNLGAGWQGTQKLSTVTMSSGSTVTIQTNANDPAIQIDPNDPTTVYIATDLAIGEMEHTTTYTAPGTEMASAQGIEGLVINDLDYYELAPTNKHLWIATKSGAAFALNYDPTNPMSVSMASSWVYPIFAAGDGAPHRAIAIDPNDKANVLIATQNVYRNETGDGLDGAGVFDPLLVSDAGNWTEVFNPENYDDDPATSPGTTHPLFSGNVRRNYGTAIEWQTSSTGSCDRVYYTVANTDEGKQGGVFYSDDDGATWNIDTLSGSRFSSPINTLVSNDNFLWVGAGDEMGRASLNGVYARRSLCGSSDWWKPTTSDPLFTDIQANHYVTAIDGAVTPSDPSYDAMVYIGSNEINGDIYRVTLGLQANSATCTTSGFACWQFYDVTPPAIYGAVAAIAVEPFNPDHVWVAYSNCIQESVDTGRTWSDFGGSCTDDHENIETLVYDDLIAGTTQGAYAYTAVDSDGDGVDDDNDDFQEDPAASLDTDGDGMPDDWNDGATQEQIAASTLTLDNDDDNDGYSDLEERAAGSDPLADQSVPDSDGLSIGLIKAAIDITNGESSDSSDDDTTNSDDNDDSDSSDWSVIDSVASVDISLNDPCKGIGPIYALHTTPDYVWVGCGNGGGLWKSRDYGVTFEQAHPSNDLYVFDIRSSSNGEVLLCGRDYDTDPDYERVLARKWDGTSWKNLLWYGNNNTESNRVYMSNCGQLIEHPNGGLMAMSNTAGLMAYSDDNGLTWTPTETFEESNLNGERAVYQIANLASTSDGIYGAGSIDSIPPVFFRPSTAGFADWFNLKAVSVDDAIITRAVALGTPNDGSTWFVGGRLEGAGPEAAAIFYFSKDDGDTWSRIDTGPEIDIIRDIEFGSDGLTGIVVGDRYPTSLGGFAATTQDAGETWTEIDVELPVDLQRTVIDGDRFYIGGNGYLFGGSF